VKKTCLSSVVAAKQAVIFDLFHTLTSLESTGPGRPQTSEILGVPHDSWIEQLTATANDRYTGKEKDPLEITRRLAHAIDPAIPEETIQRATEYRLDRFRGALVNAPAVTMSTLKALRELGKKLGLVSNADVAEMAGWGESPLAPLFDSVIFSCRVGYVKPQKEIYQLSMRELRAGPSDCLFVGDGGSDELRGARDIGITAVMITGHIARAFPERIAERRENADFVIESLDELVTGC